MKSRVSIGEFGLIFASTAIPLVAWSNVYLTEDQTLKAIFPNVSMTKKSIPLNPEEMKKIEETSGEKVRGASVPVWVGPKKDVLFVDQVIGKHEYITFAVGISDGKVKGIEILEYRENYGQGVMKPEWRKQFVGKGRDSSLRLNQDIVNISGATLSSAHVTAGVRRILQTYEVIRSRI